MVKYVLSGALVLVVSGCATTPKEWQTIGENKLAGTVLLAYEYTAVEKPVIEQEKSGEIASAQCKTWGFSAAEKYGEELFRCKEPSTLYGGCKTMQRRQEFKCVGEKGD